MRYTSSGAPDPSFGTQGKVVTGFSPGSDDMVQAMAVQDDGKIVVAGSSGPAQPPIRTKLALARYTGGGQLDPSFGDGGLVLTDFGAPISGASAVALLADGKILAAGSSTLDNGDFQFALARYTRDGRLDASFGTGGTVLTDFRAGNDDYARGKKGRVLSQSPAAGREAADWALVNLVLSRGRK